MYAPILYATIVLSACLIHFAQAGGYYTPDYSTEPVTPGGYGDWDDGSLTGGTIAPSPPKAKRRLRYNKKRSVPPEADSSESPKRGRSSVNVLSEDLRQPMIQASKSYHGWKRDVLDRVNILETEVTIKSNNGAAGESNGVVDHLMAAGIIHSSQKIKRETGFQETP